jgi:hypothetical protein
MLQEWLKVLPIGMKDSENSLQLLKLQQTELFIGDR